MTIFQLIFNIFYHIIEIVIIVLVIKAIIKIIKSISHSTDSTRINPRIPDKIDNYLLQEDVKYELSHQLKRIADSIENNKSIIKSAILEANSEVDTAWIDSYYRIMHTSYSLDRNLNLYNSKNLEYKRFQYYTSLWFRSLQVADMAYEEYQMISRNLEKLSNCHISSDIMSTLKTARDTMLSRVHELNYNTAILRDKIGEECGERGKRWREERRRNKKK